MKTINNQSLKNLSLRRAGIAIASLLFSGGVVAAGGVRTALAQQQNPPQWGEELTDLEPNSPGVISLEEVSEEAEKLAGSTVTINGKVERIIAPNAFILQETGSLYNDDRVLVILGNAPQHAIFEDGKVQVTGEVRQLVAAELERDYELTWDLELKRKLEVEYTGAATVVANLTRVLPSE